MNCITLSYIIRDFLRVMYEHRNIYECFKKQLLLINIVHFLDKFNKIYYNMLHQFWLKMV